MAHRTIHTAAPGQLYAAMWMEWHAECPGCGETAMLLDLGAAETARDAERAARQLARAGRTEGWRPVRGRWMCPACADT